MPRSAQFTVYPDKDGIVMRWKRNGRRIVIKMKDVSETSAAQEAIPLLIEALATLRSGNDKGVATVA